jgi:hypothetical protein
MAETLFALRIRRGRSDRTGRRGLLRRRCRAVSAIRSAAGDERKGDDSEAGDDDFFHKWIVGLMFNEQSMMTPSDTPRHGV